VVHRPKWDAVYISIGPELLSALLSSPLFISKLPFVAAFKLKTGASEIVLRARNGSTVPNKNHMELIYIPVRKHSFMNERQLH
jgi:hypothetical protein